MGRSSWIGCSTTSTPPLIAEDFVQEGRPPSEFLTEVANTNLGQSCRVRLFHRRPTRWGAPPRLGEVTRSETGLRDKRLWLRFEVPLIEPVDPHSGRLTFAVYDPTYYIEILHLEGEPVAFSRAGAPMRASDASLRPARALRLSRSPPRSTVTQSAGDGLGELFAETVVVECR